MSIKRLTREFIDLQKDPNYLFSISMENIFEWDFIILGPQDTLYENGIFKGKIHFPHSYPNEPPSIKFNDDMIHPNIYKDGLVCISILHKGIDETGYELPHERWSPTQNVNTIMLSTISLLSNPNFESPANIDVSLLFKNNYSQYKKNIYQLVSKTQSI